MYTPWMRYSGYSACKKHLGKDRSKAFYQRQKLAKIMENVQIVQIVLGMNWTCSGISQEIMMTG